MSLRGKNTPLCSFAPAKINLALHIRGRRDDGYHELESLAAFASEGDDLSLEPGSVLALEVSGSNAHHLGMSDDNLIIKAVRALQKRLPGVWVGRFHLNKKLPIASGIGGGSADAAAALRLIAQVNGLQLSDPNLLAAALEAGADVPVCLASQACFMRGVGESLDYSPSLPKMAAILVNPGFAVATSQVFAALGLKRGQRYKTEPMDSLQAADRFDTVLAFLKRSRNDLEAPAIGLNPKIKDVLDAVDKTAECLLARMSGSGATVFGLYPDDKKADAAATFIASHHPDWWVRAVWLH